MITDWLIKAGLGVALLGGIVAAVHHNGYIAGASERNAYWEPLFLAAENAAHEEKLKNDRILTDQQAITESSEAHSAAIFQDLSVRYAASADRVRALSLRVAASSAAHCGEVPPISSAAPQSHDLSPSAERAARAGDSLSDLGRRCELDAANLDGLQNWIRAQQKVNP